MSGNVNTTSVLCSFVSVCANVSVVIALYLSLIKQQLLVTQRYTVLQETEKTDH